MRCSICGRELEAGQAIVRYEGLEMDTAVSTTSRSYSGGVCHVGCLDGLKDAVMSDLGRACAEALEPVPA